MKRIAIIATACVLMGILVGGVYWNHHTKSTLVGKHVVEIRKTRKEDIRTDINGLLVLKTSNGRAVCVTDNDTVQAEIRFNASGEILSKKGISPLKASLFNESAPKTLTEMENEFGAPHCDIGYGMDLPTYILDDGRIVTYQTNGEAITGNTIRSVFEA